LSRFNICSTSLRFWKINKSKMDNETRQFLDECLRKAGERIRNRTPEQTAQLERDLLTIGLNTQAALETLENGQRKAYQNLRRNTYRGIA